MLGNIILSGGTTMMQGFAQRVKLSLPQSLENDGIHTSNFHIVAEGNRDISTWIGASMVSSMTSFDKAFIKKEDYHESGEDRIPLFSKIF